MAAPKKTSTAKKPASTTSKDAKASKAKKTAPQHPAYKGNYEYINRVFLD